MIEALRRIEHGGPADPDRVEGIAGTGEEFSFLLEEGRTFLHAVTTPLVERGFQAAALRIVDADWEPLVYALPALAEDRGRVFRYSDPITARGGARIEMARAIFGWRDDAPFTHCHGIWIEGDGRTRGGHVLPEKTIIVKGGVAHGIGLKDVRIRADLDRETGFTLFHPVTVPGVQTNPGPRRAVAARIKPNVDISEAMEGLCRRHGFARAEVYGGIGNLNGAIFEDGSTVPDIGSESMILSGSVSSGLNQEPVAHLHIAFVGLDGRVHRGTLARGCNPVGVTFEFILASGFLTGKYRSEQDFGKSARGQGMTRYLNERGHRILQVLDEVAAEEQATPAQVALAWLMARPGLTAPIASATNVAQLNELVGATRLNLSSSSIERLERASPR